ncbi:tubulin monoglycylase TTLL3-like isoform X2 [Motacilla alba alba]|uniref:tubulin monoglycylase TTLL3-like isoform X2 n=1 Tax=Motacilla alba alba TaxID=1094192 RepID=UPI0018D58F66|nr:tubulin monoglycylase TTLL3-like isoform X2 [Motacilla alba alba]
MGQRDPESSTAGTQPPRQGQHLSRVHFSHSMAQEAGDKATVGYPGSVRCSWDTGTRLSRSDTTLSRARRSGQRQAGHSAATTTRHQLGCQRLLSLQQLKKAKLHVEMAIKEKKIFMVQGPYPIIRRLLRARGWVERKVPCTGRQLEQQSGDRGKQRLRTGPSNGGGRQREVLLTPRGGAQPLLGTTDPLHHTWLPAEEEEQCDEDPSGIHDLMSYLARDQLPNFIWTNFLEAVDHQLLQEDSVLNHYARVDAFTTKEGLCISLQNLPWIEQADPNTFFPRCYRLGTRDDREAFIEDFCLTAARSLLKLALEEAGDRPARTEQVPNSAKGEARPGSPLYPELVEEALEVCKQHLGVLQHEDIDRNTPSPCRTCIDWDHFLLQYYRVAHEGAGLVLTREQRKQCQNLLQSLAEKLPQLDMEGKLNVWILKPGAESQGRGIICMTRLEEMLQLAWSCTAPSVQVGRWVVQKYVERLLTIFGTKFDIRQWFVVTDWKPLTVWFYQDCYLRFCSRPFSLHHLERARHLCNVSVQKWYKTSPDQDSRVPPDKIWSNEQFQEYLAQLGQADAWHKVLVPGMKAAILNALRSARDRVRFRKGNFELYGADFVVGEDYQPWLLEINSCPTMSPSSAVTRRLCANVQRDTLCLVLDRKDNPTCSIGAFELLYKEAAVPKPLSVRVKLMVKGCSLKSLQSEQEQAQDKPPTAADNTLQDPVSPGARATRVRKRAQRQSSTSAPGAPKLSVSPGARATRVRKRAQRQLSTSAPGAPRLSLFPGGRTTQRARHRSPATLPSASKCSVSPRARTTQAPQRARHRSPTTLPSASKSSVSPGGRTTQGTQPRAARKKLPPLEQQSHCPSTSSDPPAPPKPQASSAGSQGLPRLGHLPGQPQMNGCPLDWVPMPPPRGIPRNPWLAQGSARSFPPAKPLQQPLSAQSTRTPGLEQKDTAAPRGMQKTWDTETAPGVDSTLPVLAEPTLAAPDPKELPLLCCGTQLLPRFKMIL